MKTQVGTKARPAALRRAAVAWNSRIIGAAAGNIIAAIITAQARTKAVKLAQLQPA
jgi:hypothetical protein